MRQLLVLRRLARFAVAAFAVAAFAVAGSAFADVPNPASTAEPDRTEVIPPAFRADRHFTTGASFLKSIPDGTRIDVRRLDGTQLGFVVQAGALTLALPHASVSADRRELTTPLGYVLRLVSTPNPGMQLAAPGGGSTVFDPRPALSGVITTESDGLRWEYWRDSIGLRLPDGSRVDALDHGARWELLTLNGERFTFDDPGPSSRWVSQPTLPSPPLIPDLDTWYVFGDGNDWARPANEDHVVFSWDWWPNGLPLERLVEQVGEPLRRRDLDLYFNGLGVPQTGAEAGAVLLGRRLLLGGGDQVSFTLPNQNPVSVFLLPGDWEADNYPPKPIKRQLPSLRQVPGRE